MKDILNNLNNAQRLAVETTDGPVLVLSGAGTGKTRVLTVRYSYILHNNLAQHWEILALTFTNKAANEMRARINSGQLSDVGWVGTFHSICLRILRFNWIAAGLNRDFIVFGEDDQKAVLKNIILSMGMDIKQDNPSDWIEKIQSIKDKGLTYGNGESTGKIFDAYNQELMRLNAVDFGDIILKTLELFVAHPEILEKYQRQFKYIMVDEFQDTNRAQMQLLEILAGGHGNICCVGDDDQSIYSWRGAEIKNILEFEKKYPDAKVIRLETNYRSNGAILGAANSLIRNNSGRLGKELQVADGSVFGDKIKVRNFDSDFDEAAAISELILNSKDETENGKYLDHAVLIRTGSLSRLLEEEFTRLQIPYRLVGATKFYDRMEIRDVIAYIRLLVHGFDDLSLLRIISKPRRGIGDVAISALRARATLDKSSLLDAARKSDLRGKQQLALNDFLRALDFDYNSMRPKLAVTQLLENSGYLKMWRESKDVDSQARLENINELLINVISKYETLTEFLEHASLMITEDEYTNSDIDYVSIMTIHAAKGLEFNNIYLPAWEQGIFPSDTSLGEGNLEEERRLAYVAITRARKNVTICTTNSRLMFGQWQHNLPSQFIGEIDQKFIEFQNSNYSQVKINNKKSFSKSSVSGKRYSIIGRLVFHETLGNGVVIEQDDNLLTVAFKDKGIKKVDRNFVNII